MLDVVIAALIIGALWETLWWYVREKRKDSLRGNYG